MPRRLAMSTLVDRCKKRADRESDDHIAPDEWRALISEVYGQLCCVVSEAGSRYFESVSTVTATGATSYDEPDDHLSTIGMDRVETSGIRHELIEAMPGERHALAGSTGSGHAHYFTLVDDQIKLFPNPSSGTYELLYIPQPPDLSDYADADVVDLVCPDGESFLLWGVAVLALSKSQDNVQLAMEREAAARDRLMGWAANRSLAEPRRRVLSAWPGDFRRTEWRY